MIHAIRHGQMQKWTHVASSTKAGSLQRPITGRKGFLQTPIQGRTIFSVKRQQHHQDHTLNLYSGKVKHNQLQKPDACSDNIVIVVSMGMFIFNKVFMVGFFIVVDHGDNPNNVPHLMFQQFVLNTNKKMELRATSFETTQKVQMFLIFLRIVNRRVTIRTGGAHIHILSHTF